MVNTAEDARNVVSNMKYATKGQRSSGGSRVAAYIDGDYRTWTDDNLAIIVMIETAQAVENAEAILGTEGVIGCFIGPNDLALSLGVHPSETGPGTVHEEAIQAVLAAAKKTDKAAGKHCFNAQEVTLRIRQGFQFLALASDLGFMAKAARQDFNAIDFTGAEEGSAADAKGTLY
jgi:4-hydroxy-2-oxoheptanedioate aldolase